MFERRVTMAKGAGRRAVVAVGILGMTTAGILVALVAGNSATAASAHKEHGGALPWARALSPFVKVRPGEDPGGASSWKLSLARGECEGVQVYAAPPLQHVDAQVTAFRGPKKADPLKVRVYREEFIEVKTASNSEGGTGLWPDPLIPVVDGYVGEKRNALPHDSTKERPVVLYVEVRAPTGQRPGKYTGALTLTAKGKPKLKLPLFAEVHPFTLPATSSLPTTFGTSIFSIARGHHVDAETKEGRALLQRYGQAALLHRITLHGMGIDPPPTKPLEGGGVRIDWSGYDREMAPFLEGTALPNGARFTTAEVRPNPWLKTEPERRAYLKAWREHFDQKGWTQQLFYYAKDEPKPEDHPLVLREAKEAHSVPRLPVLVTSSFDPELTPVADIVTPTLNCFYDRAGPKTCPTILSPERLRKKIGPGKQIWWYQACPAHGCDNGPFDDPETERAYSGWPSYMVDHPVVLNRAMGVLDWVAGVDGELYYATVYAYNFRDPWTEGVWDFGGNGDGTLFYPGTPEKIGGKTNIPIESLRLKHLRDGLEDYEYLHLLKALGGESFARSTARKLVRSGCEITREPERWDEVRAGWTRRLDALWNKSEYATRSAVRP